MERVDLDVVLFLCAELRAMKKDGNESICYQCSLKRLSGPFPTALTSMFLVSIILNGLLNETWSSAARVLAL